MPLGMLNAQVTPRQAKTAVVNHTTTE